MHKGSFSVSKRGASETEGGGVVPLLLFLARVSKVVFPSSAESVSAESVPSSSSLSVLGVMGERKRDEAMCASVATKQCFWLAKYKAGIASIERKAKR